MSYCSLGFRLTADGRQGGEHAEGEGGGKSLSFCLLFRLGGGAAFIPKLTTYSLPYYVLVHPMADPERTGARHEVRGRGRGDPLRQEVSRQASTRACGVKCVARLSDVVWREGEQTCVGPTQALFLQVRRSR